MNEAEQILSSSLIWEKALIECSFCRAKIWAEEDCYICPECGGKGYVQVRLVRSSNG